MKTVEGKLMDVKIILGMAAFKLLSTKRDAL